MWRANASRLRILVGRHHVMGCSLGRHAERLCLQEPVADDVDDALGRVARAVERLAQGIAAELSEQTLLVDVVVESAWLPVLGVHVGEARIKAGLAERFAKHRLMELFEIDAEDEEGQVVWDHRWGESFGLVYGLTGASRDAILTPLRQMGAKVQSLQPALAYALAASRPNIPSVKDAGLILVEQDRSLVGLLRKGRLNELDVGAHKPRNTQEARASFVAACFRAGLASDDMPLALAGWMQELSAVEEVPGGEPMPRIDLAEVA